MILRTSNNFVTFENSTKFMKTSFSSHSLLECMSINTLKDSTFYEDLVYYKVSSLILPPVKKVTIVTHIFVFFF